MLLQNSLKTVVKYFCALCFLAMAVSCAGDRSDDGIGSSGNAVSNSNQYYYGQPKYQPQPYQQQYAPQYQQVPQPYYYQPQPQTYYPPVSPYPPQGGSRFYSNPYAIPATTQYPYYDADQYYVPPTYYNNVEPQSQAQQKVLSNTGTF